MKGNEQIIVNFNRLLANEFTVANQYFLHAGIYKHWGLMKLHDIEYKEFLDEVEHADKYLKRILFLEGVPHIQNGNLCNVGNCVEEVLRVDLNLEYDAVSDLRECISYADSVHDFVSRDLMVKILVDEEQHIDFLETELSLISRIGVYNYLQSQS
ncbi:bacterioferritin [Blochmannia endosymbiont of Polyrhachis (Hedomyrma) turneri]|uniref:bacterioferritin n=1 Tax=Blochmannia endosymbiont of Polyrhachis (Hedomyrma) turneri TaxID=1505596 RepID=UPI00061A7F0A|nr:bacterioferritin [Blochmannia endosymbiont of Polyrhachis (Hedomyrma) turneri]AKC59767.1 bacterioferritin [Blochmannia endosymbiont of Polyrhachis (Hedomyrma) turneri]